MNILFVGLGGAIGAIARYLLGMLTISKEFPFMTFFINVVGAIMIGFVVGLVDHKMLISNQMILFLKVGVCGGFTTFSTFSLETLQFFENRKMGLGIVYICSSIIICVLGVYMGKGLTSLIGLS